MYPDTGAPYEARLIYRTDIDTTEWRVEFLNSAGEADSRGYWYESEFRRARIAVEPEYHVDV